MAKKKAKKSAMSRLTEDLDTAGPSTDIHMSSDKPNVDSWKIILVFIGAVVVIGAIFLVSTNTQAKTVEHNGFLFTQTACPDGSQCWEVLVNTNVGTMPIVLRHNPEQVGDVIIDQRAVDRILLLTTTNNSFLYYAFDPEAPAEAILSGVIIGTVTGERFYRIPSQAVIMGVNVTCKTNTANTAVLYITHGDQPAARLTDNGCVIITSPDADSLERTAESFVLHLLRIMRSG